MDKERTIFLDLPFAYEFYQPLNGWRSRSMAAGRVEIRFGSRKNAKPEKSHCYLSSKFCGKNETSTLSY